MNGQSAANDGRVRDYLDDRLQTAADLESLDELLNNVITQQGLLQRQLEDARREHEQATRELRDHEHGLKANTEAFHKQQSDIDRTLAIVTQSDSTDDAVARFQDVMAIYQRLEMATNYVELANDIETQRGLVSSQLGRDMGAAIDAYARLNDLARRLTLLHEAAEGAAPHLIDHLKQVTEQSRKDIFHSLASDLEISLKQIGWPKPTSTVLPKLRQDWSRQVEKLLSFQQSELLQALAENAERMSKQEPRTLAPLEVLVRPLAMRFQYHFSGDRMTNKLDKPEYFFNHVLDLINDYAGFVNDNFQESLLKLYGKTDLALVPAYVDATSAWITALLPLLHKKLESILPQVVKQSSLFSNLIHEVMAFDSQLRDEWTYTPLSPSLPFRGLSYFVLSTLEYFPVWFSVERDFALSRYDAIISDRSTGEIDFEGVEAHATKPTKAAVRVNDLLDTITDRYRPLAPFHQKMKFLIDIQIAIFDKFHSRLHNGLEAFLMGTSTVGRTMHGVSKSDASELSGVKGLDRLCRVYGSAEYLEKAIQDWSEDIFFLDLWEELQYRTQSQDKLKGDLSMKDVTSKTSATSPSSTDELQGALFDETAASYRRLRTRSEQVIIDTITYDIRASLRIYTKVSTWASMSTNPSSSKLSQTAELEQTTRMLDEYLSFLSRAVGRVAIRRIAAPVSAALQSVLWDSVILRHSFSAAGAAQLRADIEGLGLVVARHAGVAVAGRHGPLRTTRWDKLDEGLQLLELPVKGEIPEDGDPAAVTNASPIGVSEQQRKLGLWEVERRLFTDNESAREVLEELGLDILSEAEAREVLKRRVEIGS